MTIFDAVMQGIIQGLTEFLPISSDGHLSIYQHFTGNYGDSALIFTLMLHLGTLVAVLVTYRETIFELIGEAFSMLYDLFHRRLFGRQPNRTRKMIYMLVVTTLPLFGFVLIKDFITSFAEDSDIIVEGLCFLFTAVMLFMAAKSVKGRKTAREMTVRDALIIGIFQGLAILPGVSRSGSTISSGLLLGYSKEYMVTYSFILSIPAILGACVLDIPEIMAAGMVYSWPVIIAGLVSSAIVGFLAIRLIRYLVINDKFIVFSYYTFILGIVVFIIGLAEKFMGITFVI
ncbi:MAG: undecaprenyl-diphosphate phosphatase [Oscillospiraceae bacterium]|nr:undecaprenyl-diphosphate phosphatase [Oscillospiraceae bacterium]